MKAVNAQFSSSIHRNGTCSGVRQPRGASRRALLVTRMLLALLLLLLPFAPVHAGGLYMYTHQPCTRALRAQFQFPGCHLPALNAELLLSEASFLLSHNSATGYIRDRSHAWSKTGLSRRYSQNQVGSVYQQLQDGARALDVRPLLLRNGTIIMQHDAIRIPVTLDEMMRDALRWCQEHPEELVLVLTSHFLYETEAAYKFRTSNDDDDNYFDYQESYYNDDNTDDGDDAQHSTTDIVSSIGSVLNSLGISYYECSDVYQLTVAEAMELASLGDNQGYLLVLDGHDYYGTSCAKENWIESQAVTCYPRTTNANNNITTLPCTKSDEPWYNLREYMLASANNAATDSSYALGPPADLYNKPFNEIQALWQYDTASTVAGVAHLSSILQDNRQSRVNERVLNLVYDGAFDAVSLLAVDNVAWNGNALTSVLRNQCGQQQQQQSNNGDNDPLPCGTQLDPPRLKYFHVSGRQWFGAFLALYGVWFIYSVVALKQPKTLYTAYARCREWWQKQHDRHSHHSNDDGRKEELLHSQ